MSAKLKYSLLGVAGVVVVAAGLFVYFGILSNDSPAEFSLEKGSTNNTAAAPLAGDLAGTWTVAGGSQAGYRVREKLASLPAPSDAVGRVTNKVSIPLQVQRNGDQIRIVGNYDFSWDDFGMTAPSLPPFVSVTGTPKLEFDVTMSKQA